MTAPTPEQMRALADVVDWPGMPWGKPATPEQFANAAAALRAAADQLEALRSWADEHYHHFQEISELEAILNGESDD